MAERTSEQRDHFALMAVFVAALLTHAWLSTRNFSAGFMPGHEFRQAQTAFISHFIDRENDFSLLYEAPLVGKPWISVLLEVPFYEWSVVLLSRATGWPHVVSARCISLACFYLTLPALWWLLGRLGLERSRRALPLLLVLTCPVYIFYSRAFLMESMELMACAWFLVGFVGMMDRRRWPWFALTTMAGTGAALIKSATFAVWLWPAAAYVVWQLGQDVRARSGWTRPLQTAFWGVAGVTVPLGLLRLWIELTDPLKAAHASAWIFTSKNLSLGNWGLDNLQARIAPQTWRTLADRWGEGLMPPVVLLLALGLALAGVPAQRWRVAGLAAVFFLAQLLFPFAYAYQEYYFYACAVFLLGAFGIALSGLLDGRFPRWLCWLVIAILPAAQLHNYWRYYYPQQIIPSKGGFSFTEALREVTPRDSVIVVCGADWAAIIPLYAQRRALAIRNGLVYDQEYLRRAFAELNDEDVSALVMVDAERGNTTVRDLAVSAFALEAAPTFVSDRADVYCARRYADRIREDIKNRGYFDGLILPAHTGMARPIEERVKITSGAFRPMSDAFSPLPLMAYFGYGMGSFFYENTWALNAHPETNLWVRAPSGATRIEWDYGLIDLAWQRDGDKSDGVVLTVTGIRPSGSVYSIYRRELDPVNRPADRGKQREVIEFQPVPGELLHFSAQPGRGYAYDWTYWSKIHVK